MFGGDAFDGMIAGLIAIGAALMLLLWGGYELIFQDDDIRSTNPITPTIELVIEDNRVDTVYVYRHP